MFNCGVYCWIVFKDRSRKSKYAKFRNVILKIDIFSDAECSEKANHAIRFSLGSMVLRHLSEWHLSERHLSEPFLATAHLSDWLLERLIIWANVILAIIKYSEYQFQRSQFERVFHGYHGGAFERKIL